MFIHLGDVEGGEDYLEAVVECEKHIIRGNNDFFTELPREEEFEIGPYHAFITHGHYYYVSMGMGTIIEEGRSRGADLVMFGHTHRPFFLQKDGMTILNPGSLSFPRQEGRRGSYMIMEVDGDGKLSFEQNIYNCSNYQKTKTKETICTLFLQKTSKKQSQKVKNFKNLLTF